MGNMYRGLNKTSMPTKHQRVRITNEEQMGFSSQAKRFPSKVSPNESPGPGAYGCMPSPGIHSPSFSKKGTTGFVPSKASRASRNPQRGTPGPNAYNLQRSLIDQHDFNVGASRVFRLPVAVQLDGPKHRTPAPNQYHVGCGVGQRFSSAVGTSAFLSKTGRDSSYPDKNVPSPCHYEVNNSAVQQGSKAVLSPFKSKTQRIPPPVDHRVPGPGAYSSHQTPAPVRRTILSVPRRRCCLAISAPPLTVPMDPPLPGPGQYDIGTYDGPSKRPTAAFASRTERIPHNSPADTGPGPGFYDPQILRKHSFFYNDCRVWIPV